MRRVILLFALLLVAAACGSSADTGSGPAVTETGGTGEQTPIVMPDSTGEPSGPAPDTPANLPDSDYPDVVVADLAGDSVNLRTLALESKPVLLWFWAPH